MTKEEAENTFEEWYNNHPDLEEWENRGAVEDAAESSWIASRKGMVPVWRLKEIHAVAKEIYEDIGLYDAYEEFDEGIELLIEEYGE